MYCKIHVIQRYSVAWKIVINVLSVEMKSCFILWLITGVKLLS